MSVAHFDAPTTPGSLKDGYSSSGSDSMMGSRGSSPSLLTSPTPAADAAGEAKVKKEDDEKKPVKKRKSWGQQLPTPTTNLPPR